MPSSSPLWSADELRARLGDADLVLVDTRFSLMDVEAGRRAYEAGHIPGAVYADLNRDLSAPVVPGVTGRHPWPSVTAATQTLRALGIDPGSTVLVYDDASGAIAARLWALLHWLGHERVFVLDGGFSAWVAAGGELSTEAPVPRTGTFTPHERPELLVDAPAVEAAVARGAPVLLDARATPRFRGDEEPIDPVAGHIPGARSLPFSELLEGGRFTSPERIRAAFERALTGAAPEESICYCGSGVTACHLLLGAAHAGLPLPRLYAGSYSEWITDPAHAVWRGDSGP